MTSDSGAWALPGTRQDAAAVAGIPDADAAVTAPGDRPGALLWAASGLLVASASARTAYFFTHMGTGSPQYQFASQLAKEGFAVLLALACAALLSARRTRRTIEGVVCALGLLSLTRDLNELRPTLLDAPFGRMGYRLLAVSLVLTSAAGAVVLARVLREARRPRDRQSRPDRGTALIGGLAGAGVWFAAEPLPWIRMGEDTASGARTTFDCCGWSQVAGWGKADMAAAGIALLALAFLAATGRSRAFSFGLLLGAVLFLTDELVDFTVQMTAPAASTFGMDQAGAYSDYTIDPLPAFWFGVAGIGILAVVAVLRLALAPKRAAYPEARRRRPLG